MNKMHKTKIAFISIATALFCFSCASSGGSSSSSSTNTNYTVYLLENNEYYQITSANPVKVVSGEDAKFNIRLKNNVGIDSLKHQDQKVEMTYSTNASNTTTITIPNIRYSARYNLECFDSVYSISYYPNGGNYISGEDASLPYEGRYPIKYRLRPNTEIGTDRIARDGYVLTGWNSKEDGSGERVGLGSRVSIPESNSLNLYAMWEKENPVSEFDFFVEDDKAYVTRYHGSLEKVVVPSTYELKPVVGVFKDAFIGNEKTVILPSSIKTVSDGAFSNSKIHELYFFDNISNINNTSFVNCNDFSTIHINAIVPPRYGKDNLYSEINLADKYDMLITNKDKKKLLVFGGSGAFVSLNTKTIEDVMNSGTICINMAVNGWFNGVAQFEMMLPYLKEGDTFIHVPETSSQFGLLYGTTMLPEINGFEYNKYRFYSTLETNYDLISLVDYRHVEYLLTGFNMFNAGRQGLKPTTYNDYKNEVTLYGKTYQNDLAYIDDRGNWTLPKPELAGPNDAGEADIVVEYITDEAAHTRLNHYYDLIRGKGAKLYYANAPINYDTLQKRLDDPSAFDGQSEAGHLYYGRPKEIPAPGYPNIAVWVREYQQAVADYLNVEVLLPLEELLYTTEDFFEPDYHLDDEASEEYTALFIKALQGRGGI